MSQINRQNRPRATGPKSNTADWEPFKSKLGMVRLALCTAWDPIGVFGIPQTLDEYDSYANEVLKLAEATMNADQVADLLKTFEAEAMGIRNREDRSLLTAITIVQALSNWNDLNSLPGDAESHS